MPAPSIRPMSMSRTPATPSSSTRQASTNAFSWNRSTIRSSTAVRSGVLIEALPGLGAQRALLDQILHPAVDVEAVPVGLAQVVGHLHRRVQAGHVRHPERAHRHLRALAHELVDLLDGGAGLVLVAPHLARR